jgi:hypothetical protein
VGHLHAVLALLDPLIPGVFGDALRNLEGFISARPHQQDGVLPQRAGALRAQDFDRAREHLYLHHALVVVHAKARLGAGSKRGASRFDLVEIVAFRDDVEGGITLLQGHAIDLAAARREDELRELEERELP